ncbi:ryanodine receptor 3-like [Silurus asotus]|uniref:Ryanodine receptor 3-like n=1 Tax=Silurus asotus TaxID=30991 RepID=A0AAD5AZU1_SILAS|nr:ryanodine receptor 3-like [Silurus asotus]
MPVAFLEPHLNTHNPFSVFNTKTSREQAILGMPDTVEQMCPEVPRLECLMKDINDMSESGARYTEMPHVIEVVLPMLCNYLSYWWKRGTENQAKGTATECSTTVTSEHLSVILGNILKILNSNLGIDEASWMKRIAVYAQPIISKARADLLKTHFLPTLEKLKKKTVKVVAEEELLKADNKGDTQEAELLILDEFAMLCRDLYAFYPMLIRYVDNNRSRWLKEPDADSNELFRMVAEIFILWCKSQNFKREEQNFVVQNEINNLTFLTGDSKTNMPKAGGQDQERKHKKRRGEVYSIQTSLIVAALKKMLPIGLNMCTPGDQELISLAKTRYGLKDTDEEVKEHLRQNMHLQVKVEQPLRSKKCVWQKLLSKQRKRAVVACFRMAPLYNLPRHRSINLFLTGYQRIWIETETYSFEEKLVQDLARTHKEEEEEEVDKIHPDPLHELILHFSHNALTERSVLDLNAFERQNKAEGLGMVTEEGSNFQNFLRTQTGNTTTVNIIISTVDYLLRLQESISDFYWYYSGKDIMDEAGQLNFSKALAVAKQVFNSLTEYIQDSSQIKLLKELMDLQKDMIVMMLSLLEGNVVNGTIGKQMVDTLVESSSNVEMILKFFDMFLKLKDLTTSDNFKEHDSDSKGIISKREFQKSMENQKQYSQSEIEFLLSCVEADENDMFNYVEFVKRFHEPAKDIGFNVAVLLTNLSEHMPYDSRLATFLNLAESVLNYFEPFLGRIEIMGGAKRIERVYFEISESSRTQWEKPQVKESKRQFIFDVVNEGGESEKMELFVNFCEDTIFEMQLASVISETDAVERGEDEDELQNVTKELVLEEEENVLESSSAFTMAFAAMKKNLSRLGRLLTLKNLGKQYKKLRKMSLREIIAGFFYFFWMIFTGLLCFLYNLVWCFFLILWSTLFGGGLVEGAKNIKVTDILGNMPDPTQFGIHGDVLETEKLEVNEASVVAEIDQLAQGDKTEIDLISELLTIQSKKEGGKHGAEPGLGDVSEVVGVDSPSLVSAVRRKKAQEAASKKPADNESNADSEKADTEDGEKNNQGKAKELLIEPLFEEQKKTLKRRCGQKKEQPEAIMASFFAGLDIYQTKILNYLARNFYNLRFLALFVAFAINFILLFYKVTDEESEEVDSWRSEEEDEGGIEHFILQESSGYMAPTLCFLAVLHTIISFLCVVGYYYLKVPLVVFKREKEIARKLEFDGLYITEQPSDDDIKGQWDRLVINTPLSSLDTKYHIWKMGVVFTDNSFLYLVWYTTMSILGHYNNFFFAAHLLDIAMGFKTLRTILSSVTHNGKQLVLTVGLLAVVVYLYTVVAFNFFRKFYNKSENEDEPDMKCDDMMTCYLFHMYVGVRAGGGIGDEIEDPAGDPYELYRILFDITFFFFVIVILLAIIQGLIIDAFGELRDQQEQVKEDMETKCFICGIGNDYFDTTPHGFETHTLQEHNLANYLFFLMYLVNKDETEHTGQESYVWKMYQERCWDFFPAGDCFRKQYEDQLG